MIAESGEIRLLGRTIPVAAQPWNKVFHLGPTIRDAMKGKSGVAGLGGGAYDFLCELAPEVGNEIPRWEWMGFTSAEEMAASDKPAGDGIGPSLPAIYQAIQTALEINGADTIEGIAKGILPGLTGLGKQVGQWAKALDLDPVILEEVKGTIGDALSAGLGEMVVQWRTRQITSSPSLSRNGASASGNGSASSPRSAATPKGGRTRGSQAPSPAGR